MSQLPFLRVRFSNTLTIEQCEQIAKDIKNITGVVSSRFNAVAAAHDGINEIAVTYLQPDVPGKIEKIGGFESFVRSNGPGPMYRS